MNININLYQCRYIILDNYYIDVQIKCPYHSNHKFCSISFSILPLFPPESLEYSKNFRPFSHNICSYIQPHHQPLPASDSMVCDRYPHILLQKTLCAKTTDVRFKKNNWISTKIKIKFDLKLTTIATCLRTHFTNIRLRAVMRFVLAESPMNILDSLAPYGIMHL